MIIYNDQLHPIDRNNSNAIPRNIVSVTIMSKATTGQTSDCEMANDSFIGVAVSGRIRGNNAENCKLYRLSSRGSSWNFIKSQTSANQTTWIIAHNALATFCESGLPEHFENGDIVTDWPRSKRPSKGNPESSHKAPSICVLENPPTIIAGKVVDTQGRFVLADIQNWLPVGLKELREDFHMPKIDRPKPEDSDEAWFTYVESECKLVFYAFCSLFKWVRDNDLGMFRYTASSQAMAAYRHRHMTHKIYTHKQYKVKALERSACFGGRLEIAKIGPTNKRLHLLDVRSLFPYVMQQGYFPVALNRFDMQDEYTSILPKIEWHNAVAECDIDTDLPLYPKRYTNRVAYPVGRFLTTLCGSELSAAKEAGHVVGVRCWSEYTCKPIFHEWVSSLWLMRQKYIESGDKVYERFVKQMLNSLYGKFSQLSPSWVDDPSYLAAMPWSRWTEKNITTGIRKCYRSFGWLVQREESRHEMQKTFVAVSSFITAEARLHMNRLRELAGSRNWLYQAVDSLIVNDKGLEKLDDCGEIHPCKLGKLRKQYSADSLMIYGPNDYRIGDKIVRSGVSFEGEAIEDDVVLNRRYMAKEALFRNSTPSKVREETLSFARRLGYKYGEVDIDGWTSPINASELDHTASGCIKQAGVPADATISAYC